jgi:hypothetical protein
MNNIRNTLLSLGAAIAGTKIIRTVSGIGVDDVLAPLGLTRRRPHVAESLALLGVGALVGGAVALLLAPSSGRETRERIAKKANQLGDAAVDRMRELRDEVGPRIGNAHPEAR